MNAGVSAEHARKLRTMRIQLIVQEEKRAELLAAVHQDELAKMSRHGACDTPAGDADYFDLDESRGGSGGGDGRGGEEDNEGTNRDGQHAHVREMFDVIAAEAPGGTGASGGTGGGSGQGQGQGQELEALVQVLKSEQSCDDHGNDDKM